ncbi:hypothetical protein J3E68DRAFT_77372 [Trichoderma sp. SZMC 28012]
MQEPDEYGGKNVISCSNYRSESPNSYIERPFLSILRGKNKKNKKSHAPAITCIRHDSPARSSNHAHHSCHTATDLLPHLSIPNSALPSADQSNPCSPHLVHLPLRLTTLLLLLLALPFCFAATTPSAAMSGSDVDAANPQKEAPAPPSSSGSGISIKKRKKDGLKPIITMEGPPSQRPADADVASGTGTGKASKSQDSTDMHE